MLDRPIKILHVVGRFGVGGSERQQTELIKRLPPDRFSQVVATMQITGPFFEEINERGIEVIEYPFTAFYNRTALRRYRALAGLIRERGIELVHCHDFYSNIFGTISARLAGTRRIITSRRDIGTMFSTAQRLVQRIAYGLAAAVVANSQAARDVLIRSEHLPARKIHCIYNCVDTDRFQPAPPPDGLAQSLGIPPGAPVAGIIASLRPVKGHEIFLRAAAEIHASRPEARFLIVGDGELRENLQQLAAKLSLRDAVIFAGARKDIPQLLNLMTLLVSASHSESLSNAIVEAMACGRPVVATNVGGNPELVIDDQTGYVVEPQDPHALADRALRILSHHALADRLGAAALERVRNDFTPDRLLENMQALYHSVLQNHPR